MPVTPADLTVWKQRRERFVMLTAYDALTARVLDEAEIPLGRVAAFRRFREGLDDRCAEPVVRTELHQLGSFALFA